MSTTPSGVTPFRILVVCTANICRSVMAERFLRRQIDARGLTGVEVDSCGVLFDDEPASDTVVEVLGERGIDASDHRSRTFTPALLEGVGLVVTMERTHAREVAVAADGVSPRVHTLGALGAWLVETEDLVGSPSERVARFAADQPPSALLGSGADEVDDPHGRSKRAHRGAADRIETLCNALLDGLFGPADPA